MPFCGLLNKIDTSTPSLVLHSLALSLVDNIRSYAIDRVQLPLALHHGHIIPTALNAPVDDVFAQLNSPSKTATHETKI